MGLNSEIPYQRIATCGAGTCANMPRGCWDSRVGDRGSGILGTPKSGGCCGSVGK